MADGRCILPDEDESLAWKSVVGLLYLRGITCCSHLTKHFQTWCVEQFNGCGDLGKLSHSTRHVREMLSDKRGRCVLRDPDSSKFWFQNLRVSYLEFAHAFWYLCCKQTLASLTTSYVVLPLNFSSLLYSVWNSKPAPRLSPAPHQPSNQRTEPWRRR